jgi:DNA-binding cell septation regulator SpoVG
MHAKIKVVPLRNKGTLKALATVDFDSDGVMISVSGFRIMTNNKTGDLWLAWPQVKIKDEWKPQSWCKDKDYKQELQDRALQIYRQELENPTPRANSGGNGNSNSGGGGNYQNPQSQAKPAGATQAAQGGGDDWWDGDN